jgi:hypothetical protein
VTRATELALPPRQAERWTPFGSPGGDWIFDLREVDMPTRATTRKAQKALRRGKRPTTAAGEFVREEMEHVRQGKHGAR